MQIVSHSTLHVRTLVLRPKITQADSRVKRCPLLKVFLTLTRDLFASDKFLVQRRSRRRRRRRRRSSRDHTHETTSTNATNLRRKESNKYQLSLTNPRDALHHGKRAAKKGGRSV